MFGEHDDVKITADERQLLGVTPHVTLIEIPDAGHFTLNQKPGEIAALIIEATTDATPA